MKNITMYTGPMCNFCDAAKRLFSRNNLKYEEIDISSKDGLRDEMIKKHLDETKKIEINRFKGLGEMMPAQLKETTMLPGNRTLLRIVNPEDRKKVSKTVVTDLMGNKPELRFEFIREKANLYDNIRN